MTQSIQTAPSWSQSPLVNNAPAAGTSVVWTPGVAIAGAIPGTFGDAVAALPSIGVTAIQIAGYLSELGSDAVQPAPGATVDLELVLDPGAAIVGRTIAVQQTAHGATPASVSLYTVQSRSGSTLTCVSLDNPHRATTGAALSRDNCLVTSNVIEAGTYELDGRVSLISAVSEPTLLVIREGATLVNIAGGDSIYFVGNATTTIALERTGVERNANVQFSRCIFQNFGDVEMIAFADGDQALYQLSDSNISGGTFESVLTVATAQGAIQFQGSSALGNNAVRGNGNGLTLAYDDSSVVSRTQTNLTNPQYKELSYVTRAGMRVGSGANVGTAVNVPGLQVSSVVTFAITAPGTVTDTVGYKVTVAEGSFTVAAYKADGTANNADTSAFNWMAVL